VTKEEIIAVVQEQATRLGRVPSLSQLLKERKINRNDFNKFFDSYREVLEACGMEGRGSGYQLSQEALFLEWAEIARSLGKIPSIQEYQDHSKHSIRPLLNRCGPWRKVPKRAFEYIKLGQLQGKWEDVIEIILRSSKSKEWLLRTSNTSEGLISKPQIYSEKLLYGAPLFPSVLTYEPTNEIGVIVLFATMARELRFTITHVQTEFPDCEAMREVGSGRWQRLRIEFEFESRNFLYHGHAVDGCDLIVCWRHNWEECPVEILELKSVVEKMGRLG
jgi:hypothetical protein